jgi:hypothetical protein
VTTANHSLDILTICKADHWVDNVLPRFASLIDASCTGVVRRHLLLIADPAMTPVAEGRILDKLLQQGWHTIVCRRLDESLTEQRLLAFDELRAGLLEEFGLREGLYMDPDTDVVADLQGIQRIAPTADLLWVANPLRLAPVLADLQRHGFSPPQGQDGPTLMEPGFFYLRRDLRSEFAVARENYPDVNDFVPGSTYWNIVMLTLGARAERLPDEYNRTFWDIPAAVTAARSVHYTGQWKNLQPYLEYDRVERRVFIRPERVTCGRPRYERGPESLAVIAMFRDSADYLPHALSRFETWERSGLPIRYYFLENDSTDSTAAILAEFMKRRRGRLESHRLALRYFKEGAGQNHDYIMPRARMRTFITDVAASESPLGDHEWTLLLDGDIFFSDEVLERVFAERSRDAAADSIAMLTCYTQQLYRPENVAGIAAVCPHMPEWAIVDHYFDTYTFHDDAHRHRFPFCAFARCRGCSAAGRPSNFLPLIPPDRPIVDVAAAFGGLALVPTRIIRDPRIRWTTYGSGIDQSRVLAENVMFCDRLRAITGKRVVVLQDVDCVYRR